MTREWKDVPPKRFNEDRAVAEMKRFAAAVESFDCLAWSQTTDGRRYDLVIQSADGRDLRRLDNVPRVAMDAVSTVLEAIIEEEGR